MGYQIGLNIFSMPYDFRQDSRHTDVARNLEKTIKYAYYLTGKSVVIVAHSYGNLNTL